jgi:hypothetical protein
MVIMFCLAGLFLLALGVICIAEEFIGRRHATEVLGRVIAHAKRTTGASSSSTSYRAIIRFNHTDGVNRYIEDGVGSSLPIDPIGSEKIVLLKNGNPDKARVKSNLSYVLGAIFIVFGIVCLVVFDNTSARDSIPLLIGGLTLLFLRYGRFSKLKSESTAPHKPENPFAIRQPKILKDDDLAHLLLADAQESQLEYGKRLRYRSIRRPLALFIGCAALAASAYLFANQHAFLLKAKRTPGQVVDFVSKHEGRRTMYAPVVVFEDVDTKEALRFVDSISANYRSHNYGEIVTVLYDPSDRTQAQIDRGNWNYLTSLIFAFVAVLAFFIAFVAQDNRSQTKDSPWAGQDSSRPKPEKIA